MFLAEVRVRNFRNFSDLTVKLEPGLNVIVGENNIGKTNLFDAIRVALGPASSTGSIPRLTLDDVHVGADGIRATEPILVDLRFAELTPDEQAELLDCLNFDPTNPANSTASMHYEWVWSEHRKRGHQRRWGGDRPNSEAPVPEETLQALKVILLDALRDAASSLAPGRDSRLGHLLDAVATGEDRQRILDIFREANNKLESDSLIKPVESRIVKTLREASRALSQEAFIRTSDARFERVVDGLRLLVRLTGPQAMPILTDLRANGLGYNNLLFIGTVLAELVAAKDSVLPLLLVEEPEAHLHPQLQTLLADFLGTGAAIPEDDGEADANDVQTSRRERPRPKVQTIVTTHSPTIAAHVPPEVIRVMHRDLQHAPHCVHLGSCGLIDVEVKRLRRMFDATRATLLFARGVLLVEGVTEQLLVPVLARRLGIDLAALGISVVSLAGVGFSTIAKLFGPASLRFGVSILTDGDPEVVEGTEKPAWKDALPKRDASGTVVPGARLESLRQAFEENAVVRIFSSAVTLEYDLAAAADGNAEVIFNAWNGLYKTAAKTLTLKQLQACTTNDERAVAIWRAVCLANPSHGKAELAQVLAEALDQKDEQGAYATTFVVPPYIAEAIKHVLPRAD